MNASSRTHPAEKLPQNLCQGLRRVPVDLVARSGNPGCLRPWNARPELQGGLSVGPVPLAAEDQDGTGDPPQVLPKIQVQHGPRKADNLPFGQPHLPEGPPGQEAEHRVLKPQQPLGHDAGGPDQGQGLHPLRMLQSILEGQNPSQGQAAEPEGPAQPLAVPGKGLIDFPVGYRAAPNRDKEVRTEDFALQPRAAASQLSGPWPRP